MTKKHFKELAEILGKHKAELNSMFAIAAPFDVRGVKQKFKERKIIDSYEELERDIIRVCYQNNSAFNESKFTDATEEEYQNNQ